MGELGQLSEEGRGRALDRFRLFQPYLEQNQPLQSVARAAGIPYRTAQRWVAQYRQFGLAALSRKPRDDRGERRVVSVKLKEAIEGLLFKSRLCRSRRYTSKCNAWPRSWAGGPKLFGRL